MFGGSDLLPQAGHFPHRVLGQALPLVALLAALIPLAGCMGPVRAMGGLAKSVADTTVTATKAGGTLLKKAVTVPAEAAKDAWQQAARARAEMPEEPSTVP
jgi:hypothetical protein